LAVCVGNEHIGSDGSAHGIAGTRVVIHAESDSASHAQAQLTGSDLNAHRKRLETFDIVGLQAEQY
jgi:hypothetical protein